MNEKLRQFEKESKLEIFGLGARRDVWEKALEKYAELIVQECAELCDINDKEQGDILRKHFGVEE